jgi:hypothetical protein
MISDQYPNASFYNNSPSTKYSYMCVVNSKFAAHVTSSCCCFYPVSGNILRLKHSSQLLPMAIRELSNFKLLIAYNHNMTSWWHWNFNATLTLCHEIMDFNTIHILRHTLIVMKSNLSNLSANRDYLISNYFVCHFIFSVTKDSIENICNGDIRQVAHIR